MFFRSKVPDEFEVVMKGPNVLMAADEIIALWHQSDDPAITFYVECVGYRRRKSFNRIHLGKDTTGDVLIDIDKGGDGGTWSRSMKVDMLVDFFAHILEHSECPEQHQYAYQQW